MTMNGGIIFYDGSSMIDGENYCLSSIKKNSNAFRKRIKNLQIT